MARTVKEIKRSMTDEFMSNSTIREAYGLSGTDTFDSVFSVLSIESILFHTFAVCVYVLEVMFDTFRKDVDERIAANIVPTVRWYHSQAMAFQYGDALIYDREKFSFHYAVINPDKQLVKYVAVRDKGGSIQILVSGEREGRPVPLTDEVLLSFQAYMDSVKIAGVVLSIRSLPADVIRIYAAIQVDPMIIDSTGRRLSDGTKPVEAAVSAYLSGIVYGGTFNKTKLVDAIQAVEGVIDITLDRCEAKSSSISEFITIAGNNHTAVAGCFLAEGLSNTLSYVV